MSNLAEKASKIEELFVCGQMQKHGVHGTTELEPNKSSRADKSYVGGPPPEMKRRVAAPLWNLLKKSETRDGKENLGYTNHESSTIWVNTLWKNYQNSISMSLPTSDCPKPSAAGNKAAQLETRWRSTRIAERFSLLSTGDQELARQASRQDLSARDMRKWLSEIIKRPEDQQEKILQCGEALRKARDASETAAE